MAHADDQGLAAQVGVDAPDEARVQLHEVRTEIDDVGEVGDAVAGVVDGQPDVVTERANRLQERCVVLDDLVLGRLEDDRPIGPVEHHAKLVRVSEQSRRDVQVQPATRRQALRRLDGGFEGCQLELRAQAGHPGVGEDGLGRLAGRKSGQGFVADDSAGAEIDDRLEDRVEGSLLDQLADGAPAAGLDPETTKPAGPSAMRAS